MNVINSVEQLRAINQGLGITSFLDRVPHYRFAIPQLSESSNRQASEWMSNYQNACGCFEGGLLMGITVIGFVVSYVISGRSISAFGVKEFLAFVGLLVVSTLVGKMLGVLWARVRAVQLIRQMTTLATTQSAYDFPSGGA